MIAQQQAQEAQMQQQQMPVEQQPWMAGEGFPENPDMESRRNRMIDKLVSTRMAEMEKIKGAINMARDEGMNQGVETGMARGIDTGAMIGAHRASKELSGQALPVGLGQLAQSEPEDEYEDVSQVRDELVGEQPTPGSDEMNAEVAPVVTNDDLANRAAAVAYEE